MVWYGTFDVSRSVIFRVLHFPSIVILWSIIFWSCEFSDPLTPSLPPFLLSFPSPIIQLGGLGKRYELPSGVIWVHSASAANNLGNFEGEGTLLVAFRLRG